MLQQSELHKLSEVGDLVELCRGCLRQTNERLPLETIDELDSVSYLDKWTLCHLEVALEKQDQLPKRICIECIKDLRTTFRFHQQCLRAHKEAQELLTRIDHNNDEGLVNGDDSAQRKCNENHEGGEGVERKETTSSSGNFQCPKCSMVFTRAWNLTRHLELHATYVCNICDASFANCSLYKNHMKKHDETPASSSNGIKNCSEEKSISTNYKAVRNDHNYDQSSRMTNESFNDDNMENEELTSENNDGMEIEPPAAPILIKILERKRNPTRQLRGQQPPKLDYYETNDRPVLTNEGSNRVDSDSCQCQYCKKVFRHQWVLRAHITPCLKQCAYCGKQFKYTCAYTSHMREEHLSGEASRFSCPKCKVQYVTIRGFDTHLEMQHNIRTTLMTTHDISKEKSNNTDDDPTRLYSCENCLKVLTNAKQFDEHMKTCHSRQNETGIVVDVTITDDAIKQEPPDLSDDLVTIRKIEKAFKCPQCEQLFSGDIELQTHSITQHQSIQSTQEQFECRKCKNRFENLHLLNRHKRPHRKKCHDCCKQFNNLDFLRDHIRIEHIGKSGNYFTCQACQKSFKRCCDFNRHINLHDKYTCQKCNASFVRACDLTTHVCVPTTLPKITTVPKQSQMFHCEICFKRFSTDVNLRAHMQTHTSSNSEKQKKSTSSKDKCDDFLCVLCSLACNSGPELYKHMKEHYDEYMFKCFKCNGRPFDCENRMKNHIKLHSRHAVSYECHLCGSWYPTKPTIESHMKLHKEQSSIKCDICGRRFLYAYHHQAHMASHIRNGSNPIRTVVPPTQSHNNLDSRWSSRTVKPQTISSYVCTICQKVCETLPGLKRHTVYCHPGSKVENVNVVANPNPSSENNASIYPCSNCGVIFKYQHNLQSHIAKCHTSNVTTDNVKSKCQSTTTVSPTLPPSEMNACKLCGAYFSAPVQLFRHMRTHKEIADELVFKPNICSKCGKVFTSTSTLEHHIRETHSAHDNDKNDCSSPAVKKPKLNNSTANNLKYHCKICGKNFAAPVVLNRHMKDAHHDSDDNDDDDYTPDIKKSKRDNMRKRKSTTPKFKCDDCDMKFVSQIALHEHLSTHRSKSNNSSACTLCGETFKNDSILKHHMSLHLTINQFNTVAPSTLDNMKNEPDSPTKQVYKCPHCNKKFLWSTLFKRHLKTHRKKMPTTSTAPKLSTRWRTVLINGYQYACQLCGEVFLRMDQHKRHAWDVHSKLPFICSLCDSSFLKFEQFEIHTETAHHDQQYVCAQCYLVCNTAIAYDQHIWTHANNYVFQCKTCEKRFNTEAVIERHISGMHHNTPSM